VDVTHETINVGSWVDEW